MGSRGIDYGMGRTNIDLSNGIRFGVIPLNDVTQSWCDASEADYGPASCSECGNEAVELTEVPFDLDELKVIRQDGDCRKHDVLRIPVKHRGEVNGRKEWHDAGREYACLNCARSFESENAYPEEAVYGFNLDDGEYVAHQGHDDCDIFIIKSPYYTFGPFCSPCAPGAVYLRNGSEEGAQAYCFAPDWFEAYEENEVTGEYNGEKTSCPYPVFRVEDNVCVFTPTRDVGEEE